MTTKLEEDFFFSFKKSFFLLARGGDSNSAFLKLTKILHIVSWVVKYTVRKNFYCVSQKFSHMLFSQNTFNFLNNKLKDVSITYTDIKVIYKMLALGL